ncbi:MAG: class IV adenylate cyclase [Pyrinomonadaceae bacterium]|jgi:adenylate cyclase class 2|nr:class IV adenylate cyclase [Pyrinomonadaceae bacterium]
MAIEIEKKYRLTNKQHESVRRRLSEIGAKLQGEEFEENTLYGGKGLAVDRSVLRLRRVGDRAVLTFKKRLPTPSSIKHQREDEIQVADPEALNTILAALGFTPALVYEKRRETWTLGKTEIVIDELPFGLFMEIEGKERDIRAVETRLAVIDLKAENLTYPQLTRENGKKFRGIIEARFKRARCR